MSLVGIGLAVVNVGFVLIAVGIAEGLVTASGLNILPSPSCGD